MSTTGRRLLLVSLGGTAVVVERAIDYVPERSGSENRHDDVRESESQ